MEEPKNQFLNKVRNVLTIIEENGELADKGLLADLKKHASGLQVQYNEIMNTDRDLKLGIVGRVKAGKSSFLNALLFNGEDRLPRAATPMTAALTRIKYAPSIQDQDALVHFYNKGEWNVIKSEAEKFNRMLDEEIQRQLEEAINKPRFRTMLKDPAAQAQWLEKLRLELKSNPPKELENLKGCAELVEMAAANRLSHSSLPSGDGLDQCRVSLSDLDDYVGSHGRYTPFVKYIELKMHHDGLKGIEVVDTPGLNDPVASRVDVTNNFLKECDAVLLLSSVSHFLDANDAVLVGKQIREASIGRAYIIGTMVDVGMMECPDRNVDLQTAYSRSRDNYYAQSADFLGNLEKSTGKLPQGLEKDRNPELVSSTMYGISRKMRKNQPLDVEEQHVLNRFEALFPGFDSILETPDDYEEFAGFNRVRENIYSQVQADKERILIERVGAFQTEQSALLCKLLDDLAISAERRQYLLENNDRAELEEKEKILQRCIEDSSIETRNIFESLSFDCKKTINDLKLNLRQAMGNFRRLNIESEIKTRTWETGWIFKDVHSEVYTIKKASANEAANNLEDYGQESARMISEAFSDMFNRDSLERKLRNAIYDSFQTAKADSSKADILGPVQSLLNEIAIPEIDFSGPEEAKKILFNQFSSEVRDEEIEKLKSVQSEQLGAIYANYAAKLDSLLVTITSVLTKSGATFIDKVAARVNDAYQALQEQLLDKDKNIQLYKAFIAQLKSLKNEFATME